MHLTLKKGGLLKTTLIDYPGKIASTVFLPGCNFRCPYCHNRDLVLNMEKELFSIDYITKYIESKKHLLEGVCISGGEPLIHRDIQKLIEIFRGYGLKIKIDTNGSFPERLGEIDADYIAMDIKTSPEKYYLVSGNSLDKNLQSKILKSIDFIKMSGIDHEFRTTLVPGIVNTEDMKIIAEMAEGCMLYTLNRFSTANTLDKDWKNHMCYTEEEYMEFLRILEDKKIPARIRGI